MELDGRIGREPVYLNYANESDFFRDLAQRFSSNTVINWMLNVLGRRSDLEINDIPPYEEREWGEDLDNPKILETLLAYNRGAGFYADNIEWADKWESTAMGPTHLFLDFLPDEQDGETTGCVYDFGCGTGRLIHEMVQRGKVNGWKIIGFDFSEGMVNEARVRLGGEGYDEERVQIEIVDIRSPNLEPQARLFANDEKVLGIACNSAGTHIPKAEQDDFLARISSILTENGIFYYGLKVSSDGKLFSDDKIGDRRWFTTYSRAELEKVVSIAKKHGLELITSFKIDHHDRDKPDWVELYFRKTSEAN